MLVNGIASRHKQDRGSRPYSLPNDHGHADTNQNPFNMNEVPEDKTNDHNNY